MNKEFIIKCSMEEQWVGPFMSMLKHMEQLGNLGSSKIVGIYSDGDGNFRPHFEFNIENERKFFPYPDWQVNNKGIIFDADYDKTQEEYNYDCELERIKKWEALKK